MLQLTFQEVLLTHREHEMCCFDLRCSISEILPSRSAKFPPIAGVIARAVSAYITFDL